MDLGLQNRVALVSGGSGYIGRVIGATLRAEGAHVILAGRTAAKLEAAAADVRAVAGDGVVATLLMDTDDQAAVTAAINGVVDEHGRLDVLVNTAAPSAGTLDPAKDADADAVLAAIDGKAMGYLRTTTAAMPHMRAAGYGRIVQVVGQYAHLTAGVTSAARNIVANSFSKTLADQLVGSGVTINIVAPGPVADKPATDVPMARAGQSSPTQVAAAVAFLASETSANISGVEIATGHRALGVQ